MLTKRKCREVFWLVATLGAVVAQLWWFLSPGETWVPVMAGPVLAAGWCKGKLAR